MILLILSPTIRFATVKTSLCHGLLVVSKGCRERDGNALVVLNRGGWRYDWSCDWECLLEAPEGMGVQRSALRWARRGGLGGVGSLLFPMISGKPRGNGPSLMALHTFFLALLFL